MPARQKLIPALLRLYSGRLFGEWRSLATAPMLPFWPRSDGAGGEIRAAPPPLPAGWEHRIITGDLLIETGGGRVFHRRRRWAEADAAQAGEPRAPADLSGLLPGGRIIARGASLVLFAGAEASLARFCDTLLPRFFGLDMVRLPPGLLLLIGLRMARTRPFQDAIADGLFRPRPFDILRRATAIGLRECHDVRVPEGALAAIAAMQAKVAALYGPFSAHETPVLVLEDSARRLPAARAALARLPDGPAFGRVEILDPALVPFARLVRRVAGAPLLIAPGESGEAAIGRLAPSPGRATLILPIEG